MTKALYALTPAQHATVLAALRLYQGAPGTIEKLYDIVTNGGTVDPLTADQIDELCMDINHSGLDMGGVCEVIGRGPEDPYVEAARRLYNDGTVTIDEQTVVSESDDGAYVMGWVWINKDEVENG